jgi:hypothetical protein
MCSTGERIAQIGLAIDRLAAETRATAGQEGQPPGDGEGAPGSNGQPAREADRPADAAAGAPASRLAELWAMLAELDPELARRLPGYLR